jgi:hypothetical protein
MVRLVKGRNVGIATDVASVTTATW